MNGAELAKIENTETRLFRVLQEMLSGGRRARLDYDELADKAHCSRSSVRYNVGKLLTVGLLGYENGKLYIKTN